MGGRAGVGNEGGVIYACVLRPLGEYLAGIEMVVSPERRLQPRHSLHVVIGEHERHELLLLQAYAVLTGQYAAKLDAQLQDAAAYLQRLPGQLASGLLVKAADLPDIVETFYAVTMERRFPNPLLGTLLNLPRG